MIHAVIGSKRSKSWVCGVFETRKRALAYLRKVPRQHRASLFAIPMSNLRLPVYIIQSANGLLFSPWTKVMRYLKPGVTIFQAIYAFKSEKPTVDEMRQLLGLADIDKVNLKTVPSLMLFWKDQEEGWAYIDSLDKAQRRRLDARKRRAIRRGMQQIREGKVHPDEEADTRLREIVDAHDERDSAKLRDHRRWSSRDRGRRTGHPARLLLEDNGRNRTAAVWQARRQR